MRRVALRSLLTPPSLNPLFELTLAFLWRRRFTNLPITNILLHFVRPFVPAKDKAPIRFSHKRALLSFSPPPPPPVMRRSMQGPTDSQVVADAILPHGHALGLRVESGAGVRHSLAHCKSERVTRRESQTFFSMCEKVCWMV